MPCKESRSTFRMSRREALQIGVGMFGLNLPAYLRAASQANGSGSGRDISCIFIFLAGGSPVAQALRGLYVAGRPQ